MALFEDPHLDCPKCDSPLQSDSAGDPACGCDLTCVRLYDPKHYFWLAFLVSAIFPIFMAASNWGRLGKTKTKHLYLGATFLACTFVSGLHAMFPSSFSGARFMVGAVSLALGLLLRDRQRPLFSAALRRGAQPAPLTRGLLGGLGMLVCLVLVFGAGFGVTYFIQFRRGLAFINEGNYRAAVPTFEHALQLAPEEDVVLLNLAYCYVMLEHWQEGADTLQRYVTRKRDNAYAFALLAYVRNRQGRHQEAEDLLSKARALDPEIIEKLWPQQDCPGPPRPV